MFPLYIKINRIFTLYYKQNIILIVLYYLLICFYTLVRLTSLKGSSRREDRKLCKHLIPSSAV